MPKREIWRVLEDHEWSLDYASEWRVEKFPNEYVDKHPVIVLEAIADFCDYNAEGRNNHTYVGTHRVLAALLHKKIGRMQATEIMREIAEYGGLDSMSGVGTKSNIFADFGIKDCWEDWKIDD